ncbi:MAG: hypothetical protein ACKVPY_00835 [Paracoccaceae bacterium]
MHDGSTLSLLPGLRIARLSGFDAEGHPLVADTTGLRAARSLADLAPADTGAEIAVADTVQGDLLVLGLLRPPLPVTEADGTAPKVVEAKGTLILRCGKASVTLHADGRIAVKGEELLSRARGANRVQGGSVQLN